MARQIILEDREWIEIANSNGEVTGDFTGIHQTWIL